MADYLAIIEVLDAAIASQVAYPLTIQVGGRMFNRTVTVRNLDDIIAARKYYANLASIKARGGRPNIAFMKNGSPR
ncbi:MAG: hypothetical protein ABSG22_10640 [Sedimentisphaerales bacterium]